MVHEWIDDSERVPRARVARERVDVEENFAHPLLRKDWLVSYNIQHERAEGEAGEKHFTGRPHTKKKL